MLMSTWIICKSLMKHYCLKKKNYFYETLLPEKEEFYSSLKMEDITD